MSSPTGAFHAPYSARFRPIESTKRPRPSRCPLWLLTVKTRLVTATRPKYPFGDGDGIADAVPRSSLPLQFPRGNISPEAIMISDQSAPQPRGWPLFLAGVSVF